MYIYIYIYIYVLYVYVHTYIHTYVRTRVYGFGEHTRGDALSKVGVRGEVWARERQASARLGVAEVALDDALDGIGSELLHLLQDGRHTLPLDDVRLEVTRVRLVQRDLAAGPVRVKRQCPQHGRHIAQPRQRHRVRVPNFFVARVAFRAHDCAERRHATLVDVDLPRGSRAR